MTRDPYVIHTLHLLNYLDQLKTYLTGGGSGVPPPPTQLTEPLPASFKVKKKGREILVKGDDSFGKEFQLTIGGEGYIVSYVYDGRELLSSPIRHARGRLILLSPLLGEGDLDLFDVTL